MARPPKVKPEQSSGAVNMSLFSEEELKQYEQEAQEEYALEAKKEAIEAFKEATKERLRKEVKFANGKDAEGEDVELITIDLAPHSPYITIDGHVYYHGVSYKFTQAQAQTINEILYRTWAHEREVRGVDSSSEYGRRRNSVISPRAA